MRTRIPTKKVCHVGVFTPIDVYIRTYCITHHVHHNEINVYLLPSRVHFSEHGRGNLYLLHAGSSIWQSHGPSSLSGYNDMQVEEDKACHDHLKAFN